MDIREDRDQERDFRREGYASREGTSRRAEESKNFIFDPVSALEVPDYGPHVHCRWIRFLKDGGQHDSLNIVGYLRQGYRFVRPDEVPDDFFADTQAYKSESIVVSGDAALMVNSAAYAQAYRDHVQRQSREAVHGVHPLQARDGGMVDTFAQNTENQVRYGVRR